MNVLTFSRLFLFVWLTVLASCTPKSDVPVVGFIDAFQDETLAQARQGFTDALADAGFSEEKNTVKILYRNAQGDIPALSQIANYFISQKVDLLATCPTLATITAVQRTKTIPVFMMVSPFPRLMKLEGATGAAPKNLFGAGEDLAYIDTSLALIPQVIRPKGKVIRIGMIFNQSEPQSVDALNRIKTRARELHLEVEALPVTNSSEALLVTRALLNKQIDAFFANPDNTVFAAFDTIVKNCDAAGVPVFTSEAGLVQRGALAAFGADIYEWGKQAGKQAAIYLETGKTDGLRVEPVNVRKRLFNAAAGRKFGISKPAGFEITGK